MMRWNMDYYGAKREAMSDGEPGRGFHAACDIITHVILMMALSSPHFPSQNL